MKSIYSNSTSGHGGGSCPGMASNMSKSLLLNLIELNDDDNDMVYQTHSYFIKSKNCIQFKNLFNVTTKNVQLNTYEYQSLGNAALSSSLYSGKDLGTTLGGFICSHIFTRISSGISYEVKEIHFSIICTDIFLCD